MPHTSETKPPSASLLRKQLLKPSLKFSIHKLNEVRKAKENREAILDFSCWLKNQYKLDDNTAHLLSRRIIRRNHYRAKLYSAILKQSPYLLQREVMVELEAEIFRLDELITKLDPDALILFIKHHGEVLRIGKQRLASLSNMILEITVTLNAAAPEANGIEASITCQGIS